jgi:AAA ATPase domain
VGRERALDTLRRELRTASNGERRFVLTAGEPGIGKTSLAAAFAREAHAAGHPGVVARPGLAARLHHHTGGNPFVLEESLRAIDDPEGVPPGVREVVLRRVTRLGPHAQEILGAAAVLGPSFQAAAIPPVATLTREGTMDVLDRAVAVRLLAAVDRGGRLTFAHDLIRRTLYDEMGPIVRAQLHDRIAQTLEYRRKELRPHAAELAHHFYEARHSLGPSRRFATRAEPRTAPRPHSPGRMLRRTWGGPSSSTSCSTRVIRPTAASYSRGSERCACAADSPTSRPTSPRRQSSPAGARARSWRARRLRMRATTTRRGSSTRSSSSCSARLSWRSTRRSRTCAHGCSRGSPRPFTSPARSCCRWRPGPRPSTSRVGSPTTRCSRPRSTARTRRC